MNVLFISNLFPNCQEPARGVFNARQIRSLAKHCPVQVIAPIDWFPLPGRFAPPASVPACETIDGLPVYHPRNYYLPKIARTLNPVLYACSIRSLVNQIRRAFPFDLIFVNWAYPDACGVARIARQLRIPFVASISGSDANWYLTMRIRRRQILAMLAQARAAVVRSGALKQLLLAHGVPDAKIHVLYNGVDREAFQPSPCHAASARRLLYVGRLSPEKGVAELLRAVAQLRNVQLDIVGDGPQRAELHQLARALQLDGTVNWLGRKRPDEIAGFLNTATVLCLPSHMEGVPNAALEAFACGVPVVATAVGGLPEIVTAETGVLAEAKNPGSFAAALTTALARTWDSAAIRAYSARFDWTENARQLFAVLQQACAS